jgi:hypothetical protein
MAEFSTNPNAATQSVETSSPGETAAHIDIVTVSAIAIVAFLISTVAHEALGHGLVSLLVGLHPTRVSSVDLEVSFTGIPAWKVRVVAAAGCVANLVLAGIAITLLRVLRTETPTTRFFLWLLGTNNLLIPGGYMMVLTFVGIGDWNDFVQGLPNMFVWRLGITLLGVIISLAGLFWGARNIDPFLGNQKRVRGRRALTLTLTAYLAGATANTLAGILNPTSPMLILISAAASSFGGTIWLLWINAAIGRSQPTTPAIALTPQRDWLWITLGIVALLVYFLVLGPGLPRSVFL